MNHITLSKLFQVIQDLDKVVTEIAGKDAMTEEQADVLISMVQTCTAVGRVALAAQDVQEHPRTTPETEDVTPAQALGMDDTMKFDFSSGTRQ